MSEVSAINRQGGEVEEEEQQQQLVMPAGFRFHPTDEELVSHYLIRKVLNCLFTCLVIADVDLNKWEPWELPGKAKMGEKEWYFFWHKGRKYPTGMRTNRATASGYWKATGRDKEIFRGGVLVGMKKTLVFHLGRAPRGKKTAWVMREYRLEGKLPPNLTPAAKDEWAVCRVFNKNLAAKPGQNPASSSAPPAAGTMERPGSPFFLDDLLNPTELPPPLVDADPPFPDDLIDLQGGATAGTSSSGYQQQVKTEQPAALQSTPPLQLQEDPCYSYFGEAGAGSVRPLEDDLWPDGVTDYSNMWNP